MTIETILNPYRLDELLIQTKYPQLSLREINDCLVISSNDENAVRSFKFGHQIEIDKTTIPTILIAGLPHTGKTTFIQNYEKKLNLEGLPITVYNENRPSFPLDLSDDYGAFNWVSAYAFSGISKLSLDFNPPSEGIRIFDGGLLDQLVFLKALDKTMSSRYRSDKSLMFKKQAFLLRKIYSEFDYLSQIDGMVILNASSKTCIKNGSITNPQLLKNISDGFKNFPQTLNRYYSNIPHTLPIVSIDFDSCKNPADILERSVNTLISWNLQGVISKG